MAVMDSNGIKNESGTIKSQTIKSERTVQTINRSVNNRVRPISSNSQLPSRNNLNKTGLNRNNKLKRNRNVAKPSGNSDEDNLNPLKRAEQNRKPLNQQYPLKSKANIEDINDDDNKDDNNNPQDLNDKKEQNNNNQSQNETREEEQNQQNPQVPQDDNQGNEDDNDEAEPGNGLGKKLLNFLRKHPAVLLGIFGFLLLFILTLIVITYISSIFAGVGASNAEMQRNYGPFFAFNSANISLVDPSRQIPVSKRALNLDEYIKGIIYADTMNLDLSSMTTEQILEFYKALIVTRKAQILGRGKYDNRSKNMTLSLKDFNYCAPENGCKMATLSGQTFYLSNDLELEVDRTSTEYGVLNNDLLLILNKAIGETISQVVTPSNVNEPLTTYKWSTPNFSSSNISSYLSIAKSGQSYDKIVTQLYSGYKVYNLDDYVAQYETVFLSLYSFWWPIGSMTPDSMGSYSGDPESTYVISKYGPSFSTQTINKGMKISGYCNSTKVIAPKDGKISFVGTSEQYGTYVIINHEDNVRTLLGSLAPGSIKVSVNQEVLQGDLIGLVGSVENRSTNCYLYVEMYSNNMNVDPLQYFSDEYPRPMLAKYIKFVQGVDNKQTVCKTLLASGFNKSAVAGLMANIEHESGFRLDALSDGGTSNGLFQWHKGRLDNLRNYCGAEYLTSIKCQLDFFLYEITEGSEKNDGAYNYLMGNHSAYDMGYQFCVLFERPAGGTTSADNRGKLAESKYKNYVNNGCN